MVNNPIGSRKYYRSIILTSVLITRILCVHWQDIGADKTSVASSRSFRSSDRSFRDETDSTSLTSVHKRIIAQRMPKSNIHRNISVDSTNIPEQQQEVPISPTASGSQPNDTSYSTFSTTTAVTAVDLCVADTVTSKSAVPVAGTSKSLNSKNMSKAAVLRNLFFSQHQDGSSGSGSAGNSKA